ncbi:MAG: hypothetical protein KY445_08045 [Armatimonadetes bacterium]|nr:hypothetical protein [Armatimonadota bacterium]
MSLNLHTTTAMIDENGELRGLEKLEPLRSQLVQVVIVSQREPQYDDSDLTPQQWNKMLMQSSAFKEWADPAEDIYTLEDGQPIEWDKP